MNTLSGTILLVEDDENDIFFMRRALSKASLASPIQISTNGQEALDYLQGVGKYSDRTAHPLPQCIFLDLKLPYVHGFQILEWIRGNPELQHLPVFILTSSPEESDRQRAAQLGALAYLLKPPTPEMILETLKLLPSVLDSCLSDAGAPKDRSTATV